MTNTSKQSSWALLALALCILLASLATSIANVALPSLALAMQASFQQVQWVVLAYLLTLTCLIVSVGRLGDLFGKRRVLLSGLALFALAALLCALAPSLPFLLAARALQGLGAAILLSLSMALVGAVVAKEKTGRAMGLLGTMSALGTALGPSIGGALLAYANWPAIFFCQVPLALIAWHLALRYLPLDASRASKTRFDFLGSSVLAASLCAFALAMTLARGTFALLHFVLLASALAGLALFIYVEKRVAAPLIALSLLRERNLRISLLCSALVANVMMATMVVGPFYLLRGFALTQVELGLALSLGPLAAAIAGWPAGRLVDAYGASRIALAGLAAIVLACLTLALLPLACGLASYLTAIVVATTGYAFFQAANNTAVMAEIKPEQRGLIASLLNLARNLGLISGAAGMAALFAYGTGSVQILTASSKALETGMHYTFGLSALLLLLAWGLLWTTSASDKDVCASVVRN